ncbi:Sfi1 spindle body protein-domain-containing protein [Dipodascopsis uninucleata]
MSDDDSFTRLLPLSSGPLPRRTDNATPSSAPAATRNRLSAHTVAVSDEENEGVSDSDDDFVPQRAMLHHEKLRHAVADRLTSNDPDRANSDDEDGEDNINAIYDNGVDMKYRYSQGMNVNDNEDASASLNYYVGAQDVAKVARLGNIAAGTPTNTGLTSVDINVLRAIVQQARKNNTPPSAFPEILTAYDSVLRQRGIDPASDTSYFTLLMKLARAPGSDWVAKFNALLVEINAVVTSSRQVTLARAADKFHWTSVKVKYVGKWRASLRRARLDRARIYISRWRVTLARRRDEDQTVIDDVRERLNQFVIAEKFTEWRQLTQLRRADAYRDEVLTRKSLTLWIAKTDVAVEQTVTADDFYAEISAKFAIKRWNGALSKIANLNKLSDIFIRRRTIRKAWSDWNAARQRSRTIEVFFKATSKIYAKKFFLNWRSNASDMARASAFANLSLVHRTFRDLRLQLRLSFVVRAINQKILQKALYSWALAERLALLKRVTARRTAKKVFKHWVSAASVRATELSVASRRLQLRARRRYFDRWRTSLLCIVQMKESAMEFAQARSLAYLYNVVQNTRMRVDQLDRAGDTFVKGNVLRRWRSALSESRLKSKMKVLEKYVVDHDHELSRKVLYIWLERTADCLDLSIASSELATSFEKRRLTTILVKWRNTSLERTKQVFEAEYHSRKVLLKYVFSKWISRTEYVWSHQRRADLMFDVNSLLRAQNILRRWSMRNVHVGILKDKAAVFAEKQRQIRVRLILASWADLAIRRQKARNNFSKQDIINLLDVDDTLPTVNSIDRHIYSVNNSHDNDDNDNNDDYNDSDKDSLTYTPTKPSTKRTTRVTFVDPPELTPGGTPTIERWNRLRDSPIFAGRRKLFMTPLRRRPNGSVDSGRSDPGKTI